MLLRYEDNPLVVENANAYIGDLLLTLHQFDESEKHLQKALALNPHNPHYYYLLGFVYTYLRKWPQAIVEMKKAVNLQPQKAEYLQGLGWALYLNEELTEGLELLLKAHQLSPTEFNILNDLAVIHLEKDLARARQYAELAFQLEPRNPRVLSVLARVQATSNLVADTGDNQVYWKANETLVFRFKVTLRENPAIWRIIYVKYNQLLSSLHKGIMAAFDRQEEKPCSFFFVNKKGNRQTEFAAVPPGSSGAAKALKSIRIDSIGLYQDEEEKFAYLYDYEKPVWHDVELVDAANKVTRAKYPRTVKKEGQYPPKPPKTIKPQ
jgi:Flp pilus assembly protein TadD